MRIIQSQIVGISLSGSFAMHAFLIHFYPKSTYTLISTYIDSSSPTQFLGFHPKIEIFLFWYIKQDLKW